MRLRVTFSKTGALCYTSHLDLHTIWERTARRANLPLAYSQGFHPQPKIQLAAALPLGFIGRAEVVDIWLTDDIGADLVPDQDEDKSRPYVILLQSTAPPGLTILNVEEVDPRAPALQTQVISSEYKATLLDPADETVLTRQIVALLGSTSLPRERRGKSYDLRPLIEELKLLPHPQPLSQREGGVIHLFMRLSAREGATGRPDEVLDVLGIPLEYTRVERTRIIFKNNVELLNLN